MINQAQSLPEKLAKKAEDSLFFLTTAGLGYDRLTPHLHYEMCAVAERAEIIHWLLMLVPRNHYKSTIDTVAYPIWRGVRNPNETGLIICNTMTNAQRFGQKIKNSFESRPFIRQWWPHLRPELSKRWNQNELCLPRTQDWPEPTWAFAGWDTKVTSQHFDYIIFDDLVDEETYESPELMTKMIARFEQRIAGLLRPPVHERTVIVVMNHWSAIDIACHILENHSEFHIYYKQAIIDTPEGKKPLFPEAYTMDWLLNKQKVDPFFFATQYMNNPVDPALSEHQAVWLQLYKRGDNSLILPAEAGGHEIPIGQLNIYASADPRHSLSDTYASKLRSRNAVSVDGIDYQGRRFHLDEYAAPSSPEEFLRAMLRLHKKWQPIRFGIESYGFQKALKPLAELIWKDETSKPRLELLPHDTKTSKKNRIRGGCRFFAEGKAFSHKMLPFFNEEFFVFSQGKTMDMLDCWAWNMHLMHAPSSKADAIEEREADDEYERGLRSMGGI